jgi:hypothetical protein
MDVYHKVLIQLYEATGGRESEIVDLKELVKKAGFLGSYPDIFQHMTRQSWVSETARPGTVRITHWGVKEAKKSGTSEGDEAGLAAKKEINRLIAETRELLIFLEELAADVSEDTLARAEKKLNDINSAIQKLKESVQ